MNHLRKLYISMLAGTFFFLTACGQADTPVNTTVSPSAEPTLQITSTPAPTATNTPTPTEAVVATEAPTATPEPTATPTPALTKDDFNANDFFKNSVFAGDSVLSHFYWKVPFYDKETFGGSEFLVAVSYSAREALKEQSDIHPMYKGEQKQIWESMKLIEPDRVFLFFGLNDIGVSGVDGFVKNYQTLIDNIKTAVPDAKLYILSTTPMRADFEKEKGLNNAKITEANGIMQEYCEQNNIGFIDIATMLLLEDGTLNLDYSDGKTNVHLNKTAYLMWKDVLVDYAKEQLLAEYYESIETGGTN